MQTVFALFEGYEEARRAAEDLLERGFSEADMNVVVNAPMGGQYRKVRVKAARAAGGVSPSARGLDRLLDGEQPVKLPDSGALLVGGDMATVLLTKATGVDSTLRQVLVELGLDEGTVRVATLGVQTGRILFWVRSTDERVGIVATVFRNCHAQRIAAGSNVG